MLAKSGRGGQVVVPRGGAPGGRVQLLVDAIIKLGYVPIQSRNSSATEKILAVRLIRERKAGSLSSEQEAALGNLAQGAAQHLVDAIIALGHLPTQSKKSSQAEKTLAVRLIRARKAGLLSSEQEGALGTCIAEKLMQEVRDLGRYPKRAQWSKGEGKLASDVLIARGFKQFSPEQEAELEALQQAERRKNWDEEGEKLMRQVRDLGRYPMESTNRSLTERLLAERLSRALNGGKLSPEFVAELQVLRQAGAEEKTEEKMQEVRGGSRYPMESRHDPNERQEADKPPAKKHKGTPDDSWQEGTIPVTIRMILDAHDCYGGSVGTLIVNGRGASMCMLVAQVVEKALKPDMPGRLILDDASGRIPVEVYRDQGQMTDEDELPRVGEYVRVVGTLSSCSERVQLTCRFIRRLVYDSEIPYHLIEVAHASLKLRLAEKLAMTRDKENTVNSSLPRDRSNISVVGPSDHWLHKDRSVPAP